MKNFTARCPRARWSLLGVSLSALSAGCVCGSGDPWYIVELFAEDTPASTRDVEWGGETPALGSPRTAVRVVLPHGTDSDTLPQIVEIYDEMGRLVAVPGRYVRDGYFADDGDSVGCPSTFLIYSFEGLPAGAYLIVHRRSAVPPGSQLTTMPPWADFDGEEALVSTVWHSG